MAFRIVLPDVFSAVGRTIDWTAVAANRPGEPVPVGQKLAQLGIPARMTHLRWTFTAEERDPETHLGLPAGFAVWRRPADERLDTSLSIPHDIHLLGPDLIAVTWEGSYPRVVVVADFDSASATAMGVIGAPTMDNVVSVQTLTRGKARVVTGSGPLTGLLISGSNVRVFQLAGMDAGSFANRETWTRIEIAGLPVDPAEWTGPVASYAAGQGLLPALTTPKAAAADRLRRAALLYGWDRLLETGQGAPDWQPPDPQALIGEVNADLLPMLRQVLAGPPNTHLEQKVTVTVPPPSNPQGQPIPGASSSTMQLSPLGLLLNAVSTDPHLAVALGFGTAYDATPPVVGPNDVPATGWDYMITMSFPHGFDGKPGTRPIDLAAIVCKPPDAGLAPAPSGLSATPLGYLKPATVNGPWRSSVRVAWQRLPRQGLLRVGSFAAVRRQTSPPTAQPAQPLMEPRPSGGFRPIAANGTAADATDLHAVDRDVQIPAAVTAVGLKYYTAQQDVFGLWSHWSTTQTGIVQPKVDLVRIVSVQLQASRPPTGTLCPASLVIDFSWDWTVRPPSSIRFVGRLFKAAAHGGKPADVTVPDGLDRALAIAGAPVDVAFTTGGVPSTTAEPPAPKPSVLAVNEDGTGSTPPGTGQGLVRRYRITIAGLQLDFSATDHIGVAVWARGREQADAARVGDFGPRPIVATASSPIPPVVTLEPVTLGSLPDAAGASHARIGWPAAPGAIGYHLYTASESAMRDLRGLGIAEATQTLAQRRATLEAAFVANPSRREFTRTTVRPLTATVADVTLPRGSSDIHAYVVLAVNGAGIESEWPVPTATTVAHKLITVAAPQVAVPAAPVIETRKESQGNGFGAALTVRSRPGARVGRIDLHRVRVADAATELDSMGPPVATVADSGSGWTAVRDPAGQLVVTGTDTPGGSWQRVFYRAVARADDDLSRGLLGGRSPASSVVSLVIPPSTPPELSAPTVGAPAAAPTDVLLHFTAVAPVPATPLGSHRLSVQANLQAPAPGPAGLEFEAALADVPITAATPGRHHVARISEAGSMPVHYVVIIRRSTVNHGVSAVLRLTDPLGRSTERLVTVPAGPDPDLLGLIVEQVGDPGTQLRWTTTAPLTPIVTGSYRIRVTATPVTGRPLVVDLPIDAVPPDTMPGTEQLIVRRSTKPGSPAAFRALARLAVRTMTVRISAPDGRFAEETRKVG